MRHTSSKQNSGITLVELMVVISLIGILLFLGLDMLGDYYFDNTRSLGMAVQEGDTKSSLSTLESDVSTAERFLVANSTTDPAASVPWTHTGNNSAAPQNRVLILSTYATTIPALTDGANSRQLVYSGASCDQPIKNNLVYFVKNGNLYRRTIKNTTTPCAGLTVGQKQSCGASQTGAYCQASDALMVTGVSTFNVEYYASSSATTPISNQYGSGAQTAIESTSTKTVKITLTTEQPISGHNSPMSTNIRSTRQN